MLLWLVALDDGRDRVFEDCPALVDRRSRSVDECLFERRQQNRRGDERVLVLGGVVPPEASLGECRLPVGAEFVEQVVSSPVGIAVLDVEANGDVGLVDRRRATARKLGVRFELQVDAVPDAPSKRPVDLDGRGRLRVIEGAHAST